jgi:hypothetical protein
VLRNKLWVINDAVAKRPGSSLVYSILGIQEQVKKLVKSFLRATNPANNLITVSL